MTIEDVYKRVGMTRTGHFVSPIVFESELFKFTKNASFISFLENGLKPDSNNPLLRYVKGRPKMYTSTEYSNPMYPVKRKHVNVDSYLTSFKREDKGFEYVKSRIKLVHVEKSIPIVFNYNLLDELYRYKTTKGENYKRTINKFSTVVSCINNGISMERTRFVHIPISKPIPTIKEFIEYSKKDIKRSEEVFNTDFNRFLLEMFKYLSKIGKESPFDNFSENQCFNVYFIFTYGSKASIVSLGYIMSSTMWCDHKTTMSKKKGLLAAKLFLLFIIKVIQSDSIPLEKLDGNSVIPDNLKVIEDDGVGNLKISDKELDAIVSEEIEKTVEHLEDSDALVEAVIEQSLSQEEEKLLSNTDETEIEIGLRSFDEFTSMGVISEKKAESLKERLKNSKFKVEKIPEEVIELRKEDVKLNDRVTVDDKTMLEDTLTPFMKKYIEETYETDIKNIAVSIQSAGILVEDFTIEKKNTVLGEEQTYTLHTVLPNGNKKIIRHIIPGLKKDGTFMQSGNTYIMRKQKTDLPIRKISRSESSLSSFYGKLFVERSRLESKDRGYKIMQYLKTEATNKDSSVNLVIESKNEIYEVKLPYQYTLFGRFMSMVRINGIVCFFNYHKRSKQVENGDKKLLKKMEGKDKVLFGKKGNTYYLIDMNNTIYTYHKGELKNLDIDMYKFFNINKSILPLDFATVRVKGFELPVGLFLAYMYGFRGLLKRLNVKYEKVSGRIKEQGDGSYFYIKFRDTMLKIENSEPIIGLVLYGLTELKELQNIDFSEFSTHGGLVDFCYMIGMSKYQVTEMFLMDKMFIDPITKEVLELIKEPVIFRELLLRACEILTTDYVNHPNNIKNMMIKQYDRIAGMMYKTNVDAIRSFYNGVGTYNNTVNVNPFDTMRKLNEDSATMLQEDLNPIAMLKQYEDIVLTGEFGRSKETVVGEAREIHESEIGITSESVKDSGDVGITAYSSAAPKLKNTRGIVDVKPIEELNEVNIMSTSTMLAPFNNRDDLKRMNFTSIMNGHLVPMLYAVVLPVSTGYDTVIGDRIPSKFIKKARLDGIVKSVSDKKLVVLYVDKKTETIEFKQWNTKEEAGITYMHRLDTDLRKGSRFEKDQILAFDTLFFERDIYDKKAVAIKTGVLATVAFQEIDETYEDSTTVSPNFGNKLTTPLTKVRSIVVDAKDVIKNLVSIGDYVKYHDPILSIFKNVEVREGTMNVIDEETERILKESRNASPKAEKDGYVKNIKVFYNCEKKELSASLKKIVTTLEEEHNIEFRVNSSYSIKGKPLEEGKVEIKIYIEKPLRFTNGDKGVLGNQLKFTVSANHDNKVRTKDGRPIDLKFSTKSKDNRIVESADITALLTTGVVLIQEQMIKIWKS